MRVADEGLVLVLDPERGTKPEPVSSVGPQESHLPPRQRGVDDEAVERVRFGLAPEDGRHRVGHPVAARRQIEREPIHADNPEVMDVDVPLVVEVCWDLLDHRQAEVLEDRQDIGKPGLAAPAVQADAGQALPIRLLVAKCDDEGLLVESLELLDVEARRNDVLVGLVGLGKAPPVDAREPLALRGPVERDQPLSQPIVPRPAECRDLLLEAGLRHIGDLLREAQREVDQGLLGLSERQVVLDRGRPEPLDEEALKLLPQFCVESLTGQGDENRNSSVGDVSPDEEGDLVCVPKLKKPDQGVAKVVDGCGEELVLGERVEELRDLAVVVGTLEKILGLDDLAQLAREDRRLAGRLHVRLGREQAEEPQHPDDLST